jgi:hypothetical protein
MIGSNANSRLRPRGCLKDPLGFPARSNLLMRSNTRRAAFERLVVTEKRLALLELADYSAF